MIIRPWLGADDKESLKIKQIYEAARG